MFVPDNKGIEYREAVKSFSISRLNVHCLEDDRNPYH